MNRLCERPGCSAPADVAYGFDADHLIVWLDAPVVVQGMRHGVLCRRHADAMIVPLGWMLDDRREPTLRLFKTPVVDVSGPIPRPDRRVRELGGEQLTLDSADATDTSVDITADLAEPAAVVGPETQPNAIPADAIDSAAPVVEERSDATWVPVFDQDDDLQGLLKARGRLLSRAFNGAPTDHHH